MTREEMQDVLKRVPAAMLPQVVFHLANGSTVVLDTVISYERTYVTLRGREGGITDDARAFFLPYGEISFLKVDRVFRLGELRVMYGLPDEDKPISDGVGVKPAAAEAAPREQSDPASIARKNLLDMIKAAKTTGGK